MDSDKYDRILTAYNQMMLEVRERTNVIADFLMERCTTRMLQANYEIIALNFRKIGELILFANLVGHEEEHDQWYPKSRYDWRADRYAERIKTRNPSYYPYPSEQIILPGGQHFTLLDIPAGTWMTEAELLEMMNECADLLHVKNPFARPVDYLAFPVKFAQWIQKITALLDHHTVALPGDEYSITCIMNSTQTNLPATVLMRKQIREDGAKTQIVVRGGLPRPPLRH